ncbi:MAG: choice-of-anchor J domain-containing protein [Cyclobacteriaceae bacterium]
MRQVLRYIFFSGIAFALPSFSFLLFAQERCGTVEYSKRLHPDYPTHKIEFEKWLNDQPLRQRHNRQSREQAPPYQIPVVVHIIHNGEAIGNGGNISDAQVLSQLRVLNEDFKRENADAVNTPPEFASVAGNLDVEFVLAKRDPDGLATNGIIRVNGGRSSWTMNDNYALKSTSYWPAEQYMNIWVCNLTGVHVGYAQFPESDLEGLENSSTNRLTDGVVIWHKAFGSVDDGAFSLDPDFNKGRTATHETGHFFGLNHIWGDDNGCSGTDYVDDTPNQAGSSSNCATHPKTDGCGEVIMFQNFLDYSDDVCMNLFTQGQVNRMAIVVENSPRRNSLLTSPGLLDPDPLPNDLGIRSIVFPDASVCSNIIIPVIELRNYGDNVITSARVRFMLDGTTRETIDFPLSLDPLESVEVAFSSLSISSGIHEISFEILLTNGGTDGGSYNNERSSTVIIPAFASAPFAENFNVPPPGWITNNPDGQITWQIVTAANETPGNKALKLNYYDYEDKIGEIDIFLSPILDLSSAPAATLSFDVAHARYQSSNDRLQVIVLKNCEGLSQGTLLYNKPGETLKTAPDMTAPFTPSNQNQWRKELIDLSAFIGMDKVQIAFVGINDWGNNIYLDNISLFTEETRDVALIQVVSPSPVICVDQITPRILIQNAGSVLLTDIDVQYSVNDGPVQNLSVSNLNLSFGEEKEIDLPSIQLDEGANTLAVNLANPNGTTDHNPENNEIQLAIMVNNSQDRIPLRENFDDGFTPAWTVINPAGGMNWETVSTNYGQSLYFNAFDNANIGDEAWLVSPELDFTNADQATLLFDLSYVSRNFTQEMLTILASTDCGITYSEISYNFPIPIPLNESWLPESPADWNSNVSVNLNTIVGEENVRIAFVIRNQNSNNLYLDNIEFFNTGDPDPIEIDEVYSIYGYDLDNPQLSDLKITFNLPERQDVRFSIINVTGQMETDGILSDVLNQTFPLNLSGRLPPGIYFVRVYIGSKYYTSKVFVH